MFNKQLYNTLYHDVDLSKYSFLVTGGAGFIGSNLVEYLLRYNAGHVRVLDNLSNGYFENIKDFIELPNFEFIEGDIRDLETCKIAIKGIDFISHQAALGSVPRSIKDPLLTNDVNVNGFLNIINLALKEPTVKRFVYAASSSTYGDHPDLPKVEENIGSPLSPYAVTKLVNELYAEVYSKVYNFNSIGLRYFNVFGPKQSPDNPYAAVIPIFMKKSSMGQACLINGDGETSRDFTFVENVIQANIKAMLGTPNLCHHTVLNIAYGEKTSLKELVTMINNIFSNQSDPIFQDERKGDVKHSLADISKARKTINYEPLFDIKAGLEILSENYKLN